MRLWRLMILMEMMLEVVIGVLVMEVDKVADEVTDVEIDKQTNMVVNITNEEFIGVTLAIGGQIYNQRQWRHLMANFELNQVVPPGSQIQN